MLWASIGQVLSEYDQGTITPKKCAHNGFCRVCAYIALITHLKHPQTITKLIIHINLRITVVQQYRFAFFPFTQCPKNQRSTAEKYSDKELLTYLQKHKGYFVCVPKVLRSIQLFDCLVQVIRIVCDVFSA